MPSKALVCIVALGLLSCGRAPSDPGKGLVGRWVHSDGKGVIEFLPGGAVVQTGEDEPGGTARQWVTAGSYQSWTDHDPGVLVYKAARVGREWGGSEWGGMWTLDGKGRRLFLTKDSLDTVLTRQDPVDSSAQKELIGLWKRAGAVPADHLEMGVLFSSGGIEVLVGKNPPWDAGTSGECGGWLCLAVRYEVRDGHVLEETDLLSPTARRRSRTFQVSGRELTIRQEGREDLVYRRASGGIPLTNLRLDLKAWEALD